MEVYKNKREKIVTCIVFGVYLLFLIWLVLFKFAASIGEIPCLRGINLIPFHYDQENAFHLREILYNVMAFVPAGFYFSAVFARKGIFTGTAFAAGLSLLFEVTQWVLSIGASDITDLITNTFGGFCGTLLFWFMGKCSVKHRMTIINLLGLFLEVCGGTLLIVLLTSNA